MGLLNYIKGTIKENYDLEDIEDIEDIDDFVYDDEQNTGEEQNADNSRTEDLTGLVSEFEKNYQKHEKKAKAPQKKNKKVSSEEKIQEQRRKAKEEEIKRLDLDLDVMDFGIYTPKYNCMNSEEYATKIKENRNKPEAYEPR